MAAAAVAQHVDDDILLERLPEVDRQSGHPRARLRVVAVDMEDRRTGHLRDVRAVLGRTGVLRCGGETDLVVDDDMNGAAGSVAPQQSQVQRLGHHALSCEGGVAVHHHRHHTEIAWRSVVVDTVDQVLFGAHQALQDRVDGLQVGRVGHQRHRNVVVAEHLDVVAVGAEVVLDIARSVRLRRVQVALELAEDLRVGLADDVGEHVEPTAVRHPDDHLVETMLGALVDGRVHHRDDGLGAFQ